MLNKMFHVKRFGQRGSIVAACIALLARIDSGVDRPKSLLLSTTTALSVLLEVASSHRVATCASGTDRPLGADTPALMCALTDVVSRETSSVQEGNNELETPELGRGCALTKRFLLEHFVFTPPEILRECGRDDESNRADLTDISGAVNGGVVKCCGSGAGQCGGAGR